MAIKNAVRRNPNFRFDYFLRSLSVNDIGRRCEHLMKAAEKEVEQLEYQAREAMGFPTVPSKEGEVLPPIEIPTFRVMQHQRILQKKTKAEIERKELESKLADLEAKINAAVNRLKSLNGESSAVPVSPGPSDHSIRKRAVSAADETLPNDLVALENDEGAPGPDGTYVKFPEYDGRDPPVEWKKSFTQYCNHTKKSLKATMNPEDRKDKVRQQTSLCSASLEVHLDKN